MSTLTCAVVVPTRNEEGTIQETVKAIRSFTSEVYVIDGRSEDATREKAAAAGAKVIVQKERGKGAAIRETLRDLPHDIIVFIDADGSHDAADLSKLVQPILDGKAEMVVASRYLGGSDELHGTIHNFIRMVGSSIITLAINHRWKVQLTDVENGYRAVLRKAAATAHITASDFTIEQEMVMKMLKAGHRVIEVASHEYERKAGVSKLPTSQGYKFILNFLRNML